VTATIHDLVWAGGADVATELVAAGINDFLIFDRAVISAVFDDDTDTWTLRSEDGEVCRGRVVVAGASPLVPRIPDLVGRRDFHGTAMHAATPAPYFEPAGRRVAVVGADSSAGRLIGETTGSAATVQVFPLLPRRVVPRTRRFGRPRRRRVEVIGAPIQEVTAAGIRTADGVHHHADAIVYGTGFAVRAGLPDSTLVGAKGVSIQRAWTDGAEPYLGLALHGFPNYFTLPGPDAPAAVRYVVTCLRMMGQHTRIEVRRSAQQVFNERVHLRSAPLHLDAAAFDLSSSGGVGDDGYDGPATLSVGGAAEQVRVSLAGHIEPIDGQYHWQGTVLDPIPAEFARARAVRVTVGEHTATARVTEQTAQGSHSIAGVGAPPFPRRALQLS
jgi:cation diffusion facilitator CzcD-associated flavoprotein CzcO